MAEEIKLSPPWYSYANKIKYTYGESPLVQCNELIQIDNQYLLVVNTFSNDVAVALRQLLPETVEMGNIKINVIIFNKDGYTEHIQEKEYTIEEIKTVFATALKDNPLFKDIYVPYNEIVAKMVGDIVIAIDKEVVQFYNDDISDLCRNYNEVAAKVFKEITNTKFNSNLIVGFTTIDNECHRMDQ